MRAAPDLDIWPLAEPESLSFLPAMASRAQNFEDVMLRRVLQDIREGFYVDIGAYDPLADSVTAYFYEQGWQGINVEPNPAFFRELERLRTRDTNLACLVGSSNENKLFTIVEGTGLSSAAADMVVNPAITASRRVVTVPGIRLDDVLALAGPRTIDFLKIDAEGMEAEIIQAGSFCGHRPRILLVEATKPYSHVPSHGEWEPWLLSHGYQFTLFDGLNRFYLRQEDSWRAPMFAVPPCIFDNFMPDTIALHTAPLEQRLAATERRSEAAARELEQRFAAALKYERAITRELRAERDKLAVSEALYRGMLEEPVRGARHKTRWPRAIGRV